MYKYSDYYSHDEKAEAMKAVVDAGFPELGVFTQMAELNPNLIKLFIQKEVLVNSFPMKFISEVEKQIIYVVVSSANNCEMCLSFHTAALLKQGLISQSDLDLLVAGGLPVNPKYKRLAIAAKYALSHKGILLEREKEHLRKLGISKETYAEILFFVGQIHANNMLFVYLISESCPIEEMLKKIGPFKNTVYKNPEKEMSVTCRHGVADYQGWLAAYREADSSGFHKQLGITKSVVQQGETRDNTDTCVVTHYFPESSEAMVRAVLTFDKPPFVGGDDLIAKGVVKPPFEVTWSHVVETTTHQAKPETKRVTFANDTLENETIEKTDEEEVTDVVMQMIKEDVGNEFTLEDYRKWWQRYHVKDCTMIRPSGNPITNDVFEKMLFGGDVVGHTRSLVSVDKVSVLESKKVAVVTYKDHSQFTYKGTKNNDVSTWTAVLKKVDDQWKVVQSQRSTGSPP